MATKVKLTWRSGTNVIEEECLLIAYDDTIYPMDEAIELEGLTELIMGTTDFVIFEDDDGVFGLEPAVIIKIEPVEE